MNILQFIAENIVPILSMLGFTGTGILYFKSQRVLKQSEAKSAKTAADRSELEAYNYRIKSLAEAIKSVQEEAERERLETKEREAKLAAQLTAALDLNKEKDNIIDMMKAQKLKLEQTYDSLVKENEGLREMLKTSQRRCQTQAATIAKMKKAQK